MARIELSKLMDYDPSEIVVIDTETTGLNPGTSPGDDEIIELCICDGRGTPLLVQRFGTLKKTEWPDAEVVNRISPNDVKGLPPISECRHGIQRILDRARVAVYFNAGFDSSFLKSGGLVPPEDVCDIQQEAMEMWRADYWVSLRDVLEFGNVQRSNWVCHTALGDVLATILAGGILAGTVPRSALVDVCLGMDGLFVYAHNYPLGRSR